MIQNLEVPIVTIDGDSMVGKSTVCAALADAYGFKRGNSGAVYRLLGLLANRNGLDIQGIVQVVENLDFRMEGKKMFFCGEDWTQLIASTTAGTYATQVAKNLEVREAVIRYHLKLRVWPGLVIDGRNGSREYEDPNCRIYLYCNNEVRVERGLKRSREEGLPDEHHHIVADIRTRDSQDRTRSVAPLERHPKAEMIDTSDMTARQVVLKAKRIVNLFLAELKAKQERQTIPMGAD